MGSSVARARTEQLDAGTELALALAPATCATGAAHRTTPGDCPLPPVAGHFLRGCWPASCAEHRTERRGPRLRAELSHATRVTWGSSLRLAELILIKDHDKNTQTMCV